jgi:hypothetical protein
LPSSWKLQCHLLRTCRPQQKIITNRVCRMLVCVLFVTALRTIEQFSLSHIPVDQGTDCTGRGCMIALDSQFRDTISS